jgi:spore germination protein YaaH
MLAEHADDAIAFVPGDIPPPLTTTPGEGGAVSSEDGVGAVAGLPNGLSHEVFGYLPYWMLSSSHMASLRYDLVTTIAYFSVGARQDGTLEKTINGVPTSGWAGWTSAAMTNVISAAHQRGVKVVLTVTMMAWDGDYREMSTLLNTPTYRNRLAARIAAAVKNRNADGVNLDFEPMPNSLESAYTRFVHRVKDQLVRQGAGAYLSVATTGGAASWNEGYELVDNADANSDHLVSPGGADAIMVMGYDFSWSGSARAGGVAPMASSYTLDVRRAVAAYRALVPGSKLIWGVPYYGRAWTTTTSTRYSPTCGSAGTCDAFSQAFTYTVGRERAATHGRRWDDHGKVPWYRYWHGTYDTWLQAYYDDPESLRIKYDHVKANGLRGVGIWHLLMDGSRPELWRKIATEFGATPFTDIGDSKFESAIVWVYQHGVMGGCTSSRFCPDAHLTRGALAQALADGLRLPATSRDFYADDESSRFENGINRLAAAGLTSGCGGGNYCPDRLVHRGKLATALARALKLPRATRDYFADDENSPHEGNINRIAAAGIARGCGDGNYCPGARVKRELAALFLRRAFD